MRILLLLVLAASLAACHASQYYSRQSRSAYGLEAAAVEQNIEFVCIPELDTVKVSLHCAAGGGPASWSLVDPSGDVRWSGTITGRLEVTQTYRPVPGVWRLRFTGEDYTGFYALEVSGRGGSHLTLELPEPSGR